MAIVAVPGPTVTVIVANSLSSGARAGLWNVVGTQLGLLLLVTILAFGFGAIVESVAALFTVLRYVGAAYLAWLGYKLWRANGSSLIQRGKGVALPAKGYILQGFFVLCANPKALFFFGAFFPQFIDTSRPVVSQVFVLGFVFMVVGGVLDSLYALTAGRAGRWLSSTRVLWVERLSGTFLIGGGLWLLSQGHR